MISLGLHSTYQYGEDRWLGNNYAGTSKQCLDGAQTVSKWLYLPTITIKRYIGHISKEMAFDLLFSCSLLDFEREFPRPFFTKRL